MFNYLDGWLNWNRCKEGFYIKGCDGFPWFQPFALELLNEMLGIFEVMWGLAYKGFDDVGKLLSNTISDGPPTGNNGPEGGACFMDFGQAIKLRGNCTGGVKLFVFLGVEASSLFNVFEKGNKFLRWEVGSLGENFVGVGVLK